MAVIVRANMEIEELDGVKVPAFSRNVSADETGWLTYEVADGVSEQAFPISTTTGITTVDVFYITSDQAISWKCVAGETAIGLDANGAHCLFGTSLTAILVSNASGSTANVKIYVAGT